MITTNNILEHFTEKLKEEDNVAILTHDSPDCDAMGAMMGLEWILKAHIGCNIHLYFTGEISHPQNKTFRNLLEPNLKYISEYTESLYKMVILVDTIPSNCTLPENTSASITIDHHTTKPNKNYKGILIHHKTGSCCSIIYDIISTSNHSFDMNKESDRCVATAMLTGIITDTENLMSDDTTELEFISYSKLFEFRDNNKLRQITKYKRPANWISIQAESFSKKTVKDGYGIVGLGKISSDDRDLIAVIADEMQTWHSIDTSICYAIIDGSTIEGSVRSQNASISVSELCERFSGENGNGGGKLGKGAYRYNLGAMKIEPSDDEELQNKDLDFLNNKEERRLLNIIFK